MVKLAPALPKEYDDNGLESNTRHLLEVYTSQKYIPIVALVRTKEITQNEHFERVPKIELVHVEIATDSDDADAVREIIRQLHDARVQHIKQPLDLPDTEEPPVLAQPLELTSGGGEYYVRLIDQDGSKFSIELHAASGALVLTRSALPREDYGELVPGDYPVAQLGGEIGELATLLVQEFEQGFTSDDVVDAEVVDEATAEDQDD
ncbi:hypothetical protein [Microbacterium sp. 3J1]|uniref:hypothetical protein n=1 Tax=Microbacterium sp. 3J1 TaxID=861269 RepID=UPI000A663F9F|nr:hypothetical protein [Microbacterium sp. 3J1]